MLIGKTMILWVGLWMVSAVLAPSSIANPISAGQMIFTDLKCMQCHTVKVLAIHLLISEDDDIESDEDAVWIDPPDLSEVGNKYKPNFISKWLLHEEKIEGRMHKVKFRGNAEQLRVLTAWLVTLKKENLNK